MINETCNCSKAVSTHSKIINIIRKKWRRDIDNVQLLKFESKQLHHLIDKMIADGRITLDELRANVNSRVEAKSILKIGNGKRKM